MKLFLDSVVEKTILIISPKINNSTRISRELKVCSSNLSIIISQLIKEGYLKSTKYKDVTGILGQKNFKRMYAGAGGSVLEFTEKGEKIRFHLESIKKLIQ